MPVVRPFTIAVTIDRIATGGAGIANAPDGRIVLVDGALPGDLVKVEITKEHKRLLEGSAKEVLVAGPHRAPVTCHHFQSGCGGCDWQFSIPTAATELRRQIVADSLRRLGKFEDVEVVADASAPTLGVVDYRTTVRAAVEDGIAGFRKSKSNDLVMVSDCQTAHPLAERILTEGRFPSAKEIVIKVGARTGERLVITDAPMGAFRKMIVPIGTKTISREQLKSGETSWIHEEVAGHRYRISADSFFQCRPDGAEALVRLVSEAIAGSSGPLVDAYSGVGLFGAALGQDRELTAIESNPSSVEDAKVNLPASATILRSKVERWKPTKAGAVIADPARRGLGTDGVSVLSATGAEVLALVSCDPASLARDARLLVDAGFTLDWVRTVDLFGQTSHVEAVSKFSR